MKNLIIPGILFLILATTSCEKLGLTPSSLGGTQSTIGEVGNTFTASAIEGVSNFSASVTDLTDGISSISFSCQVDDPALLAMIPYLPGHTVSGSTVSGTVKAKITDQGIMNVYDEGNLMLVKYSDKVGDKYTLKVDGKTITRTVVSKSTTDDYSYGFFLIKTIDVEETGSEIPGISKVVYHANHRFGLVGIEAVYEDGSSMGINIYSYNEN